MKKLNIGDIVNIASGGPKMTITDIVYTCSWFDINNVLNSASFSGEALMSIKEDEYEDLGEAPKKLVAMLTANKAPVSDLLTKKSSEVLDRCNEIPVAPIDTFNIEVSDSGTISLSNVE